MKWHEAEQLADVFLNSFENIESIYCNSSWDEVLMSDSKHPNELELNGWNNISRNYWYDYGVFIVSKTQIGILWFGDES